MTASAGDHATRVAALLLFVVPSVLLSWYFDVSSSLISFLDWCSSHRIISIPVYLVLNVIASVFLLPDVVLSVGAGAVWGVAWGFLFSYTASIVALVLGFGLGRAALRQWVLSFLNSHQVWPAVDVALSEESSFVDWKVVGLLRLSALIPFQLQNFMLGATAVPALTYVAASAVGIIPGTALTAYFGHVGHDVHKLSKGDLSINKSASTVMAAIGGLALLAAFILMVIYVQRSLQRRLAEAREDQLHSELTPYEKQKRKSVEEAHSRSQLLANEV